MKKVVLSVAIMSFALLANAQVLKKDLLKDYKPGDQLEKAVYGDKKEPIRTDSWNGAFSTNPLEGVGSPLGANRGKVFVAREGKDKIKFGVSVRNMRTEGTETYDYDKTHLLILKVDYDKNQASLFVNPELSKKEPKATLVADGEENDLKNGLKGISFRYRRGYKGRVGNFRFADNWATAIGK